MSINKYRLKNDFFQGIYSMGCGPCVHRIGIDQYPSVSLSIDLDGSWPPLSGQGDLPDESGRCTRSDPDRIRTDSRRSCDGRSSS